MKIRWLLITVLAVVSTSCSAQRYDAATLSKDSLESSLYERFVPKSFLKSLEKLDFDPKFLGWNFAGDWYRENASDTGRTRFLIYGGDGLGGGFLRLIGFERGGWKVLAETDSVIGMVHLGIGFEDVDCDGRNEIILTYVSGEGCTGMDVVKYAQGKLTLLTPTGRRRKAPWGRTVDLRKDSAGCSWRIEVTLDGPIKYEPDRMETFRLDPVQKTFKMVSEEKWPRRKEEKK